MKTWALRFAFCAVVAIGLFLNASAQPAATTPADPTRAGVIKVGKVDGEVIRSTSAGESTALKVGDTLIETDTVTTGARAQVVLVFMNGSSVKLGADTKLEIATFKMDPLAEDIVVAKLESEPTVSKTELKLAYGEMIGDVKHLNTGSSFNIQTPVGAAGIRGTQFRIVFRPSGDGRSFTFQLSTADGRVVFEGTGQSSGAPINVPKDEEIIVTAEATVDTATGTVTVTSVDVPATTVPISEAAKTTITEAVTTAITQAVQATTITTTEQQQSSNNTQTDTNSNSNNTNSNSSAEKKDDTTTPGTDASSNSTNNTNATNNQSSNNTNNNAPDSTPSTNTGNPNPPATPTSRAPTLTSGAGG